MFQPTAGCDYAFVLVIILDPVQGNTLFVCKETGRINANFCVLCKKL